jgi:serine/threonine-protein kinase
MLTRDGVKVLDFGLAKTPRRVVGQDDVTGVAAALTSEGTILGTPQYMAPEQYEGKEADERSDIFAFGCVVYEMVTGKRCFDGKTKASLIASVLGGEPVAMSALIPVTPPALERLVKRCIEKDPEDRYQSMRDVVLELRSIGAGGTEVPRADRKSAPLAWMVAAGVLAVALGIALWALWRAQKPVDHPLIRLDVDLGADVSLPPVARGNPLAISPDGTRLVYASGTPVRLFTRRLDQAKATELPGTQGALGPFFSPDGRWVGFSSGGKLNKISVEGGAVVPLADVANFGGASWGEDGNILVSDARKGLMRVPAGGGAPQMVAEVAKGEVALASPQILPGGKAILFASYPAQNADTASIQTMTLQDRHRKVVAPGGTSPRYLAMQNGAGYLLYTNDRSTLFAVPFDPDKLETRGTALPMLDDVARSVRGAAQLEISRTGALVYRRGGQDAGLLTVTWIEGAGKTEPLLAKPGRYDRPELSPDGQRLALDVLEGSGVDIWVYDFKRDTMTRLTFTGNGQNAIWSPDGRYIAFWALGEGTFATRSDGAGQTQPLTRSKNRQAPWSFTPDGRQLAFGDLDSKSGWDLWTVPVESDGAGLHAGTPVVYLQTPANERSPALSPDGHWLAYSSDESGTYQIYVRAFPDKGAKWQISNSGGIYPMWSRNGRELFFETTDNRIMVAPYTVKGDSFAADKPLLWSDRKLGGVAGSRNVTIASDGKRFAALMPAAAPETEQAQNQVVFLLNFSDELRRRFLAGK